MESLRQILDRLTDREMLQEQAGINHMMNTILRRDTKARIRRAIKMQKIEYDVGDDNGDSNRPNNEYSAYKRLPESERVDIHL